MTLHPRPLLWLAACLPLLGGGFLLSHAAPNDREALRQVERLSGDTPVRTLPPGEYRVRVWEMGSDRQWDLKPVAVSLLLQAGSAVYARERDGERWWLGTLSTREPQAVECYSTFKNLNEMVKASTYRPLPKPPAGFRIREVARMPELAVRLAGDARGETLYALSYNGDVWQVDVRGGGVRPALSGDSYLKAKQGRYDRNVLGIMLDAERRLYLVANERVDARPIRNEVTIFRAPVSTDGSIGKPQPWLRANYPWGIGAYNHGVSHLATGPDGKLYVSSGSRTDGNETGSDARYSREGEVNLTACIWRLDPKANSPQIEVFARGLRNAFGFCWNERGELFCTENGPNAHAPEELNELRAGGHYGFPFQFSDWKKKPYRYTPDPPPGLQFEPPIANLGPAAGGSRDRPLYTFQPHSSPSGIVALGNNFPEAYRGGLLIARFGNLLDDVPHAGFDVLHATLQRNREGRYEARIREFLKPVARPIDLFLAGRGRVYVLEYSRQTDNQGFGSNMPGRILELSAAQ